MWVALLPVVNTVKNVLKVPAIAAFLAGLAGQILGFFTNFLTRKVAINLTIITMILGLALTVALSIKALATGLSYIAPPELVQGLSLFIPDNATYCVSIVFSAKVIRWVWSWQFYVITKVSS